MVHYSGKFIISGSLYRDSTVLALTMLLTFNVENTNCLLPRESPIVGLQPRMASSASVFVRLFLRIFYTNFELSISVPRNNDCFQF